MSEEYIGKRYRFAPILGSNSVFTPMGNTWKINHALECVQRAISIYLKHDVDGYYHDLDKIKEKLSEIWNSAENIFGGDDRLGNYIQSILVEEHEVFSETDLPIVYSKTYRYVYGYPLKEFVLDVE